MGGSTVPMENSGLSPAATSSSHHELGADAVSKDILANDVDSAAADGKRDSSPPLDGVGVEEDCAGIENGGSLSEGPDDNMPTAEDFWPIKLTREWFLQFVLDHFITDHLIEATEPENDDCAAQAGVDEVNAREPREVRYEGDPAFPLPLSYLVKEVDARLDSLDVTDEKTIGVPLHSNVGLYRSLIKKFPKTGPRTYRRRQLRTSINSRTYFPELEIVREKIPLSITVVNGLEIVVKPNGVPIDDAECFKWLTGRDEVAVSPQDYKFYTPRDTQKPDDSKYASHISSSNWAAPWNSNHSFESFPVDSGETESYINSEYGFDTDSETDDSPTEAAAQNFGSNAQSRDQQAAPSMHQTKSMPDQPQIHPIHQNLNQKILQTSPTSHFPQNQPDMTHSPHSPTLSQHRSCSPPLDGPGVGGRVRVMASIPANFCDQCGTRYLRESSKFCSDCGVSRQKIQKKVRMDSRPEDVTGQDEGAAAHHDSKLYSPTEEQKAFVSDSTLHIPKFSSLNQPAAPSKYQTQPAFQVGAASPPAKFLRVGTCEDCGAYYRNGTKVCSSDEEIRCDVCKSYYPALSKVCTVCGLSPERKRKARKSDTF